MHKKIFKQFSIFELTNPKKRDIIIKLSDESERKSEATALGKSFS